MIRNIQKKAKDAKGFTLAELLIVVAIIAVLVAIAIPVFTAQLNRSKAGTDLANIRAGYADAQTKLLSGALNSGSYVLQNDGTVTSSETANYICKGNAGDADTDAVVGGKKASEIGWTKGNTVTFNTDGTKVTGIKGVTN